MRFFYLAVGCLLASSVFAGEVKYPVSAIPEKLLREANVVKRVEEIEFRIINSAETVYKQKYALTILNENGDDNASFSEYYDKLRKIVSIDGALYDAAGNLVKKLKSKDIQDESAVSDISLMDDSRRKKHDFYCRSYPYTIEYEVVVQYNNTLFFPYWMPQDDEKLSVEQSTYTLTCPQDYMVRYKAFHYGSEPEVTTEKGTKRMQWKVSALPAFTFQYASPSWKDMTTLVYFAPSEFEIQGYKGKMSTWKDFGLFQNALNAGRDVLPADVLQTVQQLTANSKDVREKVSVLYHYLQKNTRYISIQLGLGGWQPFEAAYVAKKGYGDCKALSNYMYSLLKAAGIRSNYALVNGGENFYHKDLVIDDFPMNRFNHVILCVPLQKDSIWLECTSQSEPAGYLGNFTGNRKALLITEEGGVLASTPRYDLQANTQVRTIQAKLNGEGVIDAQVNTLYSGIQQDHVSGMIHALSQDEVKKQLNKNFALGTYEVTNFAYKETPAPLPKIEEQLTMQVANYVTISGRRLFITPNMLNREGMKPAFDSTRTYDYVYDIGWRDEDHTEIELPAGYQVESTQQNVSLKNKFGSYSTTVKLEGGKLIYHRIREQYAGRFPAKEGKELEKFLDDIYRADHNRMVLVKNGN